MTLDEHELIRQIQQGNRKLYRMVVKQYQHQVYAVSLQATGHPKEAEDLTQEVFLQAYRSLSSFRFQSRFSTWLYRIAINKGLDWKRKKSRTPALLSPDIDQQSVSSSADLPENILLKKEEQHRVRQMVEDLPDRYRNVVQRYYFDEQPYEDIATELGIALKTVETRLYRARKMLHQIMEK